MTWDCEILPLFSSPSYHGIDFYPSASNHEAYALIEAWPEWPHFCTIIYGPPGSGKTHLGKIFQEKSGAVSPQIGQDMSHLEDVVLLDDVVLRGNLHRKEEENLFHLYNRLKEYQKSLLILTQDAPCSWKLNLPDLDSRLKSSSCIGLKIPDDPLLFTVYRKLFSDCQVVVSNPVVSYLVKISPRSLQEVMARAHFLVQRSWHLKKPITIPFVKYCIKD